MLIFRTLRKTPKLTVKIAHATLHATSIVCISFGLAVEFIPRGYHGMRDMYTLHSWLGMAAIVIFFSQFVVGFLCYLWPAFSELVKVFYMPIHVFFGILCFVLAVATCLIGLNQNAIFTTTYNQLPPAGVLINIIGMLMAVYGTLVVYLVTKSRFKRNDGVVKIEK